jgi:hypothetical protein
LVDKVFWGRVPRIELKPTISIRSPTAKKPQALVCIQLKPLADTLSLEESFIADKNDYQNNKMDSGQKTPLEAE